MNIQNNVVIVKACIISSISYLHRLSNRVTTSSTVLYVQVSGAGDEDDVADEQLFMQESLELHYNVAELVGTYRVLPMCTYIRKNENYCKSRNLHLLIHIFNYVAPHHILMMITNYLSFALPLF